MTATTALDPSFGRRGLVLGAVETGAGADLTNPTALAVQSDGKVVEVGTTPAEAFGGPSRLFVRRYDADGSPDATFGTGGLLVVPAPTATAVPSSALGNVAVLADGSILFVAAFSDRAAGPATGNRDPAAVVKVTPAGTLDATFGVGGAALLPRSSGVASFLVAEPDGTIVAAGTRVDYGTSNNSTYAFTLTRFTPAGTLDATFGAGGEVDLAPPQSGAANAISSARFQGLVALPNGQILLAANQYAPQTDEPAQQADILARANADGTLDPTFGSGGFATIGGPTTVDPMTVTDVTAVAAQPDGKIVVGALTSSTLGTTPFLARLLPDGSLDASFAARPAAIVAALAVGGDGTITVAGAFDGGSAASPLVVQRFLPDGGADLAFGARGRATYRLNSPSQSPISGSFESTNVGGIALAPGGAVVVASTIHVGLRYQAALARLLPVAAIPAAGDYDGDGTSDPAVLLPDGRFAYRTAEGDTILDLGRGAFRQLGLPAAGDYDGDGTTDPAVFLGDQAQLNYQGSTFGPNAYVTFGTVGVGLTIPAPGDYDGDGRTDVAAYLPGPGAFAIRTDAVGNPGDRFVTFGNPGLTVPAPGDYDGDGITDIAGYLGRYGILAYRPSTGGPDVYVPFGQPGDKATIPAPGDYDGDGKTDVAAYLPRYAVFAYRPSSGGPDVLTSFGAVGVGGSIPAPGDYDGDGKTDRAVYLPQYAVFAYRPSSGGPDVLQTFGAPGTAVSIPAASIPDAQPSTVSGLALAAAMPAPGIELPLTDDLLATLAGTPRPRRG